MNHGHKILEFHLGDNVSHHDASWWIELLRKLLLDASDFFFYLGRLPVRAVAALVAVRHGGGFGVSFWGCRKTAFERQPNGERIEDK